jgi:hypothetical protein
MPLARIACAVACVCVPCAVRRASRVVVRHSSGGVGDCIALHCIAWPHLAVGDRQHVQEHDDAAEPPDMRSGGDGGRKPQL